MSKLVELQQQRLDSIEKMRAILDKADAEKRDVTPEEETEYTTLDKTIEEFNAKIKREERVDKLEADAQTIRNPLYKPNAPAIIGKAENDEEFKSFSDFLRATLVNPRDKRLVEVEAREQSMGTGVKGGFMVPPQFSRELYEVPIQEAVFAGRCRQIPAGSPPDSPITIPTMDQSAGKGKMSGVDVSWTAEGGTKAATDFYLKEVTLQPHEVSGHIVVTDRLLANWEAAASVISTKLSQAVMHAIETAIVSGNGVARPKGILNSGATIKIARNTAANIKWVDIYTMYSRMQFGGNLVWIGSQTIHPQLINLLDAASHLIWQPNAREGEPNRLLGIPLITDNRLPVLGSEGDLGLYDLSYYLLKPGSGPSIGWSEHVYFTSNKTVCKLFTNIDGQPWLSTTLPLEGSTANTVSPFVVMTT